MNLPQERNEQQVNQSPEGAMKWRANTCLCCFPTLEQVTKTPSEILSAELRWGISCPKLQQLHESLKLGMSKVLT